MKTAIVYASVHHKNTEKLVKAIAEKHPEVELIDATKTILKDLASYDLIGFASGIFYSNIKLYRFPAFVFRDKRLRDHPVAFARLS